MLYLLETKLLEKKSIFIELTKIYGINKTNAYIICKKLGFSFNLKVNDLTLEQTQEIFTVIESLNLTLNNDLKTLKAQNLETLISIKTYRGLRRVKKLPVRGQRTHTNAKSAKKGIF
jgi:small subunit ribosomal protein S13